MDNLKRFGQILNTENLDGFLVSNPTNIFYLTGFKGLLSQDREAYLVCSPIRRKASLITARLYQQEASEIKSKYLNVAITKERNEMLKLVSKLIVKCKKVGSPTEASAQVGFEENDLKYGEHKELSLGSDPREGPTLIPTKNLVENLRIIKTEDEINKIEKAQIISQKAFKHILKTIKVGQTEEEIADNLAKIIKSLGGEGLSFESIIASGPNSGKPHHKTGNRQLAINDILLLDFGAKFQNYHADLSRTIFIGKARNPQINIYNHVKKAQKQATTKIRHGVKLSEAYHSANNHFKKYKLEKYFLHGLGHGIGLEIHEEPYLRPRYTQPRLGIARQAGVVDLLLNNMVFSVEPGLYFPWGGVRIEDLVVIKNGKAKVLGKTVDEIIEIVV